MKEIVEKIKSLVDTSCEILKKYGLNTSVSFNTAVMKLLRIAAPNASSERLLKYGMVSAYPTITQWLKYKVIYDLDAALAAALDNTDSIPIYISLLKKLPYSSFFIVDSYYEDTIGFFVHIEHELIVNEYALSIVQIEKDDKYSCYLIYFRDGETVSDAISRSMERSERVTVKSDNYDEGPNIPNYILSILYYLASENSDVKEVKTSKSSRIKRADGRPLNIKRWDVGYRVGPQLKVKQAEAEIDADKPATSTKTVKARGPIHPHVRRAHWHHYWVGEGRSELTIRWIEPTYVGGTIKGLVPTVCKIKKGELL